MQQQQSTESLHERIVRTGGYPCYMAHRGGGGVYGPENTLYTCRLSAQQWPRLRMLEVDVRVTRDGKLVLMHDSSVDRTTEGQGTISEMLLEEIQALNAAHNYPALRTQNQARITVPTFEEFLEEFVGPVDDRDNEPTTLYSPDLMFMFDFKDEVTIELAWPLIQSYGSRLHGRYMLGAVFETSNRLLDRLRRSVFTKDGGSTLSALMPPLMTDIAQTFALTLAHGTGLWSLYAFGQHDVFGYVLQSQSPLFLTEGLVQALHQQGMRVMACGPRLAEGDMMRHCLACQIDYIMVDGVASEKGERH